MSFFKQFGRLANGLVTLTNGSPGPTVILTPPADEFVDVYNIVISTNDATLQQVTVDDGTTVFGTYFLVNTQPVVLDLSNIPVRGKKGGTIRATAGAVSAGKSITVKVVALTSKT